MLILDIEIALLFMKSLLNSIAGRLANIPARNCSGAVTRYSFSRTTSI